MFSAPHEHATCHTTPPDTSPGQGIVHAKPRNKGGYSSRIEGYD